VDIDWSKGVGLALLQYMFSLVKLNPVTPNKYLIFKSLSGRC